ncbi:MAG TPA: lytic transglycosylase domain-containing protein [Xanthobacteraceae bacterium]|nr:lytic transglycosylase domain-containing protein [Xanthobacteraceae bacterium]
MRIPTRQRSAARWIATIAAIAVLGCDAAAAPERGTKRVPVPRARPTLAATEPAAAPARRSVPLAAAGVTTSSGDLNSVREALERIRRRSFADALEIEKTIQDPVARKLVDWAFLRSDDGGADFDHYVAFIEANPTWPSTGMLRRRAEDALWHENRSPATVRAFFATIKPSTPRGRFALARALIAQGDRAAAQFYVREAWRGDAFSQDLEAQALETFHDLIGAADHKARMDRRLYANDTEAAMRAARRLGDTAIAIARARIATNAKAANALELLDAIPAEARSDPGYMFSRIQWLRRHDRIDEAARLMLAAPHDADVLHDLDEWWVERRLIARKLLDQDNAQAAYQVARDAAPPSKENYRGEHQFTAGWIALRFLHDPTTALAHFVRIGHGISNPITLARCEYWQSRALEELGRHEEARSHLEAAARFPTAYYGQIARAKLGYGEIALRRLPEPTPAQHASLMALEVVRAVEILYAINERELVIPIVADLGERSTDVGALMMLAEVTARHEDARSMLLIGKEALGRGYPFDHYAFPTVGVPAFAAIGPGLDRSVVYSIVRQESAFNPRDVSSANALGLMQVTPEAGRYVAKKFGVRFDQKRLMSDQVYNTQMGAGELGDLLQDYRGSYIMAFAGYNAGRGRVHEWIERYGDPRDPKVDPIDWVERIPFSETRNYVERVMENLQVYRVRLGQGSKLMIEADLRRGSAGN